jgi:hypothetical protein
LKDVDVSELRKGKEENELKKNITNMEEYQAPNDNFSFH